MNDPRRKTRIEPHHHLHQDIDIIAVATNHRILQADLVVHRIGLLIIRRERKNIQTRTNIGIKIKTQTKVEDIETSYRRRIDINLVNTQIKNCAATTTVVRKKKKTKEMIAIQIQ